MKKYDINNYTKIKTLKKLIISLKINLSDQKKCELYSNMQHNCSKLDFRNLDILDKKNCIDYNMGSCCCIHSCIHFDIDWHMDYMDSLDSIHFDKMSLWLKFVVYLDDRYIFGKSLQLILSIFVEKILSAYF
ncbi:hypothetical protein BpHYR1_016797 [Brachionus plicatilis]|uniref:Uncharacterized protein n=1 Tax=Brachionus plicatilis TaxID=10195 RepID=A0A3M7RLQ9_BRAPC|nr:hypothetical protein BpHYR1_016797 [Brachionus plicatilis]